MFQPSANDNAASKILAASPPVVPLRKPSLPLESIAVGQFIQFAASCPLPPLKGNAAQVIAIRHYRFGEEILKNFQLQVGVAKHFFLTIAEDEQGHYLSLSRALDAAEQDGWFGRDALGFFMEPSTAKTIRCKTDLMLEGDWAAARYSKTVDWVEGSVTQAEKGRAARGFHYNLLVNEDGDKSLEIEHDDTTGENRVFVTVYRPVSDIAEIMVKPAAAAKPTAPLAAAKPTEPLLFREPVITREEPPAQPKQRPDFRRLDVRDIPEMQVVRAKPSIVEEAPEEPPLPSFLLSREHNYLSLDEVIPPEPERVRVGIHAALTIIEQALLKKVRVRDVLRETLGLESALSDEVIFELPLTENDYRTLAMRYKLRADHRVEIRARLEEELRSKLT